MAVSALNRIARSRFGAFMAAIFILSTELALHAQGTFSIDPNFTVGDGASPGGLDFETNQVAIRVIAPLQDGRVYIAGGFTNFNSAPAPGLARLLPSGSIDGVFSPVLQSGATSMVYALAPQADGKLIVGGSFDGALVRLNEDGSQDHGFTAPGLISTGLVYAAAVLDDGSILAAGRFQGSEQLALLSARGELVRQIGTNSVAGEVRYFGRGGAIVRSSSRDKYYFGVGSGFKSFSLPLGSISDERAAIQFANVFNSASFFALTELSDGSVVGAGGFKLQIPLASPPSSFVSTNLFKARADGSLDLMRLYSFPSLAPARAVVAQQDDRFIVGGSFQSLNDVAVSRLARFTAEGDLDPSLNVSADDAVYALAWDRNGNLLVGGNFSGINGVKSPGLARLLADVPFGPRITRQPSGKRMSVGEEAFLSVAVEANPRAQFQWKREGISIPGATNAAFIAREAGGYTVVVSNAVDAVESELATVVVHPARNSAGAVDRSFHSSPGVAGQITTHLLLPDGKILIAGDFAGYGGLARRNIARLNADGSPDPSFDTGAGPDGTIYALARQNDGKIIVGGLFRQFNDIKKAMLSRLSADGVLDTNFSRSGDIDVPGQGGVREILLQPDGYFLAGGSWSSGGGRSPVARFYPTNGYDPSFQLGWIASTSPNRVHSLAFQSDGKIVGIGDGTVFRAFTNGTVDVKTSVQLRWTNRTSVIAVQQDGKILVGGRFQQVGGVPRIDIARLNPDFTVDTNFNPVIPIEPNSGSSTNTASWGISAILVQPDQKVLIAGEFGSLNGKPASSIARLNPDGSTDESFQAAVTLGKTTNAMVMNMSFDADGKLLVSGAFSEVNGVRAEGIVRLLANGENDLSASVATTESGVEITYPVEGGFDYAVEAAGDLSAPGWSAENATTGNGTTNAANYYRIRRTIKAAP